MNTPKRMAGLALVAYTLSAATLVRHPYLQNVGAAHATILWTTAGGPGAGEVVCSAGGRQFHAFPEVRLFSPGDTALPAPFYLHRAAFAGLAADTTYDCHVQVDAGVRVPLVFRTAGPGRFRFLALADSGDGKTDQATIARRMEAEPDVAFILHAGDLAYESGTFEQLESYFFVTYRALLTNVPFFVVAGNHDYYERDAAAYRASFEAPDGLGGVRYYSFDWGDAHFTAIDTNTPLLEAVEGRGPMLRWLEQDLSRTRRLWRVVFLHHTPFPSSHHKDDPVCGMVAARVVPLLERQGVHLVISGHEHNYQRTFARRGGVFVKQGPGTVYVTTGGGGAAVHPLEPDPRLAASASVSHFVRLEVDGAQLRASAIDSAGATIDEFQLSAAPFVSAIGDAAAFQPAVAPGGLIAIVGWNLALGEGAAETLPLPVQMEGSTVMVGDEALPLLYVSRNQINVPLPFHAIPPLTLRIRTRAGTETAAAQLRSAAPQIFRTASGPAAVHLDGRLVSAAAPALKGEWIAVYATGLGDIRSGGAVRAYVGGVAAEVSYAGVAPGFAGLYQINLRIPAGAAGVLPLRIVSGEVESEAVGLAVGE